MNTFIIVNITLPSYVIDSLKDKSMLVHLKKSLPSHFACLGTHLKEELTPYILLSFENYQGIPYSHTGRVDKHGIVNILLMADINHICKRELIK